MKADRGKDASEGCRGRTDLERAGGAVGLSPPRLGRASVTLSQAFLRSFDESGRQAGTSSLCSQAESCAVSFFLLGSFESSNAGVETKYE